MERWEGKVAIVTGASTGIGAATAKKLVENGMKVVGCSNEIEILKKVERQLNDIGPGKMVAIYCDVRVEKEVLDTFQKVEEEFGALHVCVNCAGLAHNAPLLSGSVEDWNSMLAVNVIGLSLFTREAVKMMQNHKIDDGHLIQICSMSGHRVTHSPPINFYAATKHAVKALTEGLRQELRAQKSNIRATSISPGDVQSNFYYRMYPDQAANMYSQFEHLQPGDIADAVIYALSAPARVDVNDILLRPTEQLS